jgi:transposase
MTDHHRFMLRLYLQQYDAAASAIVEIDTQVDAAIAKMDAEVVAGQVTFCSLIALLCTIPGIRDLAAKTILAEIGTDMVAFRPPVISWRGPACARGRMKVPASASRLACEKAPPG